jgi:hypothetical protein
MNKIALAVVVTGVIVAVALAPIVLSQAFADKTLRCTNGGGHPKPCGSPPAKKETCTAGRDGVAEPRSCAGARE